MAASCARRSFRVMGCASDVVVVGGEPGLDELAELRLSELEQRWSRFVATSDVSRLNAAAGNWVPVDRRTLDLLRAMRQGWTATEGAFDPTVLAPLVGLGHAASWHDPSAVTSLAVGTALRGEPDRIEIDLHEAAARLPIGTAVDAGGIGKGLAADLVVTDLLAAGATGAMVNIGGDLCVRGMPPDVFGWQVAVCDPAADDSSADREVARVALVHGGVATSGVVHRSWQSPAGERVHHLLDPETARPVALGEHDVHAATVVAGTAAWAEVWTKALFVRGPQRVLPTLDHLGLGALVVYGDGTVRTNEAWSAFAVVVAA